MTFGVNDYPGYPGQTWDPYGYAARQCASFANFRCMRDLGLPAIHNPVGSNDGKDFATTLGRYYGVPVGTTPRVHDIVSLPAYVNGTDRYGHVAVVLGVNSNGTIVVEDYNWTGTGRYSQHTINAAGNIYAHVLAPPPPPIEDGDMSNVRFVYWPEKSQQHCIQLNRNGELYAKYWPGPNGNWGNAKIRDGLNPVQGLDVAFTPGQLHIACEDKGGQVHQFYQTASGTGSTTWTEQQLP